VARRDEFSPKTKEVLAKRVANRCSNPGCWAITSGPQSVPDGAINIGVAAHITAAASGGPRYDEDLSPAERASATNGIWLCQNCAKLIDSDTLRFSEAQLRAWKRNAEEAAREGLGVADARACSGILLEPEKMDFANESASMDGASFALMKEYSFVLHNRFTVPVYDVWIRFDLEGAEPDNLVIRAVPKTGVALLPGRASRADTLAFMFEEVAGKKSWMLAVCRIDPSETYGFVVSMNPDGYGERDATVVASLLKWSQAEVPLRTGRNADGLLQLLPITSPASGKIRTIQFFPPN
jgi:hypothetical protein